MSVLSNASSDAIESAILNIARPIFARAIWAWYDADPGRVLFSKWFITIRLRDLRWLVEEIAGPDDSASPGGAGASL
jgi:hypothetical protein